MNGGTATAAVQAAPQRLHPAHKLAYTQLQLQALHTRVAAPPPSLIYTAHALHTDYMYTAHALHTDYMYTAHALHTDYTCSKQLHDLCAALTAQLHGNLLSTPRPPTAPHSRFAELTQPFCCVPSPVGDGSKLSCMR
jgi:hypothetical protein